MGLGQSYAQVKASGKVIDQNGDSVPFCNVFFPNTLTGTVTDEDGAFYLESEATQQNLKVSFVGYQDTVISLKKGANYQLIVTLKEDVSALNRVVVVAKGKQPKKNNPAIDILRKIWKYKRKNGLSKFDQYQYNKYEKIEFDLNNVDSTFMKNRMFKGMELIFDYIDTSRISGKTYIPIFINESLSKVYGDNNLKKEKTELLGNKNSGFSNNQSLIAFVKDLYTKYDVYDNYIKLYDKSFTSPLSRTGINTYNYILSDSAYVDNKWCYNIIYYPRRKNELTFKGDFWVNDTTWAIKDINLEVTKSANINWIKELYIEQEFEVLNDSLFLITRDFFQSDFTLRKKESSRGMYGKRTSVFGDYKFDIAKAEKFYKKEVNPTDFDAYNRGPGFWEANRMEKLNKNERELYTMLDTLKQVKAFKNLYTLSEILTRGYINFGKLEYGPVLSTVGLNDIEGFRLRLGGRTYFGPNDLWRLEGYGAYGFRDEKFKYSIAAKILLNRKKRLKLTFGRRNDIEQLGASLTSTNDVQGRSFASNSLFSVGANQFLTNINLSSVSLSFEPVKNFVLEVNTSYRNLKPADEQLFSLAYFTDTSQTTIQSETNQLEVGTKFTYTPGKKTTGYGVDRLKVNSNYPEFFLKFTKGIKGPLGSDFDYEKAQLFYRQPINIGGLGKLKYTFEIGKTFGQVPLGLLSVVPGNQSFFSIYNTFPMLNFYEFVTDSYASLHVEHTFGGRIFSRFPLLRKLNLREFVVFRAVSGSVSEASEAINATGIPYDSPSTTPYYEYSLGVGNIFKLIRVDFNFRGNYKNRPEVRNFGITGSFGFYF